MALRRGIAKCSVQTGRSEIVVDQIGYRAVSGRADGRDVVVDGTLRRTAGKPVRYDGELVVSEPLDAIRRHLPF